MKSNLQTIEFNGPPDQVIPKWRRTLAVSGDGTVFMPAAVAGDEKKVGLCALYDGVSAAVVHKHLFLPTDWLAREYPVVADICANAEAKARESL